MKQTSTSKAESVYVDVYTGLSSVRGLKEHYN